MPASRQATRWRGTGAQRARAGGEGFVLFARSQRDTPGKLAAHALSNEALEWAAYELLATRATEAAGQLTTYLADAHAIEAPAIRLMEAGREMVKGATWTALLAGHLEQERHHRSMLEERLHAAGSKPSRVMDVVMSLEGINWALFFRAQPETTARFGAFAYAFQHLEIGGYDQLRRVAERAGDDATRVATEEILREERTTAASFADALSAAAGAGFSA